jgi:hypothetical protein
MWGNGFLTDGESPKTGSKPPFLQVYDPDGKAPFYYSKRCGGWAGNMRMLGTSGPRPSIVHEIQYITN